LRHRFELCRLLVGVDDGAEHATGELAVFDVEDVGEGVVEAEAIEWAKRAPMPDGEFIEIRQVQELADFPPDVQKAAGGTYR